MPGGFCCRISAAVSDIGDEIRSGRRVSRIQPNYPEDPLLAAEFERSRLLLEPSDLQRELRAKPACGVLLTSCSSLPSLSFSPGCSDIHASDLLDLEFQDILVLEWHPIR